MSKLSISEAAKLKGVSTSTLRRWEAEGKLIPERTANGHRRYDINQLLGIKAENSITVGYTRVNSNQQKEDLNRQAEVLEFFCISKGWSFEIIKDLGSGLNYSNKGLKRLIKLITAKQVNRLVLTHKDQILILGSELVFSLCEIYGVEVVIINRTEESTIEEDLTQDILDMINIFSARLYGSRYEKNKQLIEELKEIAKKL